MSTDQTPKRPVSRFGSVAEQFGTIGGKTEEHHQETAHHSTVKTAKLPEVKVAKRSEVQTEKSFSQQIQGEEKGQQTVRLPLSLRKWLRMRAPIEERDLSDIVAQALIEYKAKVEDEAP